MKVTIKRLKNAVIALAVVLGTVIVVLSIMLAVFVTKSDSYRLQLENSYKKNLYEFANNINSLEVDLSKLIATNSANSQKTLLTDIYDTCRAGETNLSGLPISADKTVNISNYLNSAGGYIYSLLEKNLKEKQKLTESELINVENLYNYCQKILYDLNNYMSDKENLSIVKQINYANGELSAFDGGLSNVNSSSEVPSLIYDGPFSDSVINKEVKGLASTIVTVSEAENVIKNGLKYYGEFSVNYLGETNGKIETYNFSVKNGEADFYVQVTKRGGFLLSINANSTINGTYNHTAKECEIFAHNFASLLGIDNMYSVWTQESGSIVYVNIAPVIDNIIYYTDIIKVKVDKKLGLVVGWEATNYAYNHISRTPVSPQISFLEAQEKLSPLLAVKERNLCVIPNEYVGETTAYEYICTWKDYIYYVYIDVTTGEEVKVLRVIDCSSGDLIL